MDEDQISIYHQLKRNIQSKIQVPFNDFLIKYQDDEGHWSNSQGDDGDVTELLRCRVDVNGAHLKKLKREIIDCSRLVHQGKVQDKNKLNLVHFVNEYLKKLHQ